MTARLETRSIQSGLCTEIYISASPGEELPLHDQASEIFSGIHGVLRSNKAWILQERVFSTQTAVEALRQARRRAYGDLDDGVAPSFLLASAGLSGPIAGVQVHAVSSNSRPRLVHLKGTACGRILRLPGRAYLTFSSLCDLRHEQAADQAKAMMTKAEAALKKLGADFLAVPRTWMWLKDILSWYDEFNRVRTGFFTERGLIGAGTRQAMPASTGIGLGPATAGHCAMDLIAVLEPADCTQYLQVTGKQHCALEYGSAFSRAARSLMPAGETVFVSGTAAIDADGATTHIGDAAGQINATIENVRAVLSEMKCRDDDMVQVVAYCKTTEVEKVFNSIQNKLAWPARRTASWPWLTVICDICRPDLLFEIEATAMPRQRN